MYDIMFKKQPLDIDTGSEDLDDIPDDAAEYMAEMGIAAVEISSKKKEKKVRKRKKKKTPETE